MSADDDDITLQMLDDEFSFGVVSETVVLEDGTVVELRQSSDAYLTCLHIKPFTVWLSNISSYHMPIDLYVYNMHL